MSRRLVSLGGWCGPSLVVAKHYQRLHTPSPFDAVRASLDGVIHFVENGFGADFFPPGPQPYPMDPASIWLLFRGTHTCFTHIDLNRPDVQEDFARRFAAWKKLMGGGVPVTFIRTSISENPFMESGVLPLLEATLDKVSKKSLNYRTVLITHNQGPQTGFIAAPTPRSRVWNVAYDSTVPESASLFDKTEAGYRKVLDASIGEDVWRPCVTSSAPEECVNLNTSLCTVQGVPALLGSCKGIGTTAYPVTKQCVFCGSSDGHAVVPTAFDSNKPWTDEDTAAAVECYMSVGDIVAACESVASKQGRSAYEVLVHLRKSIDQ